MTGDLFVALSLCLQGGEAPYKGSGVLGSKAIDT